VHFKKSYLWGEDLYIVPEYTFGVCVDGAEDMKLSHEHNELRWDNIEDGMKMLKYDGNKTALWELNQKVLGKGPRG